MTIKNASVTYNNFNFVAETGFPTPQITISTLTNRLNEGPIVSYTDAYNLEGVIYKTTKSSGTFDDLLRSAQDLRRAFSRDGGTLVVSGCNGASVVGSGCKVTKFELKPNSNRWSQTIDYSIELTVERTGSCSGEGFVSTATNTWQISPIEEHNVYFDQNESHRSFPIFKVTHTINAIGKYTPTGTGCPTSSTSSIMYNNAMKWVESNFENGKPPILNSLTVTGIYDFNRTIDTNIVEGSYGITDNFLYFVSGAAPPYIDTYTIQNNLDSSFNRTVSIQGTIKGFSTLKNMPSGPYPYSASGANNYIASGKFDNAVSGLEIIKPSLYARARKFVGSTGLLMCSNMPRPGGGGSFGDKILTTGWLNPQPDSFDIGYSPDKGEVTYNVTYNDRPQFMVPCAVGESLTIDDTLPGVSVAEIFVIGRKLGPVLQNMGTYSSAKRTLSYELTLPKPSSVTGGYQFPVDIYNRITGVISTFDPKHIPIVNKTFSIKSLQTENKETWNPHTGTFKKDVTWLYTQCFGDLDNFRNPLIN